MERLIKDGCCMTSISLFFGICVDCIKGKLIAKTKNDKICKSGNVLELIHIDICRPFTPIALGGYKYSSPVLIAIFLRVMWSLSVKSLILWKPLKFSNSQLTFKKGKQIQVVRLDRGGEYYGR